MAMAIRDDRRYRPVDLYASPVTVAAANVLSSSSAPRTLQKIVPHALYMRATQNISTSMTTITSGKPN